MIKRTEKVIVITTINYVNVFLQNKSNNTKNSSKIGIIFKKINNLKQKKVHRITIIYVLFIY